MTEPEAVGEPEPDTLEDLIPLAYAQLRELAAFWLSHERRDHTLQPTALVHEVYLRLADSNNNGDVDRIRFLGLASEMIQHILVDHARKRAALKRGGRTPRARISLDDVGVVGSPEGLLELHEAIERLRAIDRRRARVIELRFFGGLRYSDIGSLLGISAETAKRDWRYARAWLRRELHA